MAQGPGNSQPYRAQWLIGNLAAREAVDAFFDGNGSRWTDATYKHYCWVLYNFADTFPVIPTTLQEVLEYVGNHRLSKSKCLWEIGTVRSCYRAIRTFYSWAKAFYPGAEHLMTLPPQGDRRIKNFGRKRYQWRKPVS